VLINPARIGIASMRATRTNQMPWIALVAAMLMLVQSVAASFAARAVHPVLDAFGNPLCIARTDHKAPQSDHGKVPGCCILNCGTLASAIAPPPDKAWLDLGFDTAPIRFAPVLAEIDIASNDHDPGSPRAPPAVV